MECRNRWHMELAGQFFSPPAKTEGDVKMNDVGILKRFIICPVIGLCEFHSLRFNQFLKERDSVVRRTDFMFCRFAAGKNRHPVAQFPQLMRVPPRRNSGAVVAIVKLVVGVLVIALFENSMARLRLDITPRITWAGFGFAFLAFVSLLAA